MRKPHIFLFILIIFIAFVIRFFQLGNNPPSLHADELDTGYTAYSLIKTAHDPYGNFLPLLFKDQAENFRPPFYTYITILPTLIFGLGAFSTRFFSAFFGVISVILIFFIAKRIFNSNTVGLISAFLLSINPWSVQISRTGLEVGPLLFLVMLGIVIFLYADKKKFYLFPLSAMVLGVSFFTYHPSKIFLPLFMPFLFFYRKETLLKSKKGIIVFLLILSIAYLCMLKFAFFNNGAAEYKNVTLFSSKLAAGPVNRERHLTNATLSVSGVFHNKFTYYIKQFENMYSGIFSVNYLFLNGESNMDKGVSNHGEFYLFELPFFFYALYLLFKENKKLFILLFGWIITAGIPAGVTISGYYSYRDVLLLPVPILLSAYGLFKACFFLRDRFSQTYLYFFTFIFIILSSCLVISYLFTYFFDYPVYSAGWWQYPQKQVLSYVDKRINNYNAVYINGTTAWMEMYSFYNKIDPREFQKDYLSSFLIEDKRFMRMGKYYFGQYVYEDSKELPEFMIKPKSLYVIPGKALPKNNGDLAIPDADGVNIVYKVVHTK